MVAVDRFSKTATVVVQLPASPTLEAVASCIPLLVRDLGRPHCNVVDVGPRFSDSARSKLLSVNRDIISVSSLNDAQADERSEQDIRTVFETVRFFVWAHPTDWNKRLPSGEFSITKSVNESTGNVSFHIAQ